MTVLYWINGVPHRLNVDCGSASHSVQILQPLPPPDPNKRPYADVGYLINSISVVYPPFLDPSSAYPVGRDASWPGGVFVNPSVSISNQKVYVSGVLYGHVLPNAGISFVDYSPVTPEPGAFNDPNNVPDLTFRLKIFAGGGLYKQIDSSRLPSVSKQCDGDCPPGQRKVVLSQNTGDYCCCPVKCR